MTNRERKKAISALKKSAPIMAMTPNEFDDYIKTLNNIMDWLEQESKWISVKDRMPKDGEWVLCQLDDDFYDENTMMVLYHTDDWGEKWVDGGLGTGSYDVCAWMPLPISYQGE